MARRSRRNRNARRRARRRLLRKLPKAPLLAPRTMTVTLRYRDALTLNPGIGGVPAYNIYRINDVRDTDFTGGGRNAQPQGFDQWCSTEDAAGFYDTFIVLAVKVRAHFQNLDTVQLSRVAMVLRNDTSALVDASYMEDKDTLAKYLTAYPESDSNCDMTFHWTPWKGFGIKMKNYVNEYEFSGTSGVSPAQISYLHVLADGLGVDTGLVRVDLIFDYVVKFFNQNNLQPS